MAIRKNVNPTWCGVFDIRYGVGGGLKVPADKTRPLRSTEATTDATNHDKYCS